MHKEVASSYVSLHCFPKNNQKKKTTIKKKKETKKIKPQIIHREHERKGVSLSSLHTPLEALVNTPSETIDLDQLLQIIKVSIINR